MTPTLAQMAEAFARRDRAFDGRFVVGVVSTGIYCRPSCPARRPRPENCRFLSGPTEAEREGFRPCKRCRPGEVTRDEAAVAQALALLRGEARPVPLAQLAQACGYSPAHLQRMFTRATGLSPAAYGRALRQEAARTRLSEESNVTDAIYAAGFEGPSTFYAGMEGRLGMTPSAWARGGEGVTIRWAMAQTSLGPMLVAASEKGVCRLSFDEGEDELRARFPRAELRQGGADFAALLQQVVAAVETPSSKPDIPLDVAGTAFQQRVWEQLRAIPPGETRSYGQIAAALGQPGASRAVGSANGANPVAVLVPCHRVVQASGALGGYAYGEAIKRELLRRERED
ncbi:bifunctional transcriptional activator/DNA repair enzyme AdaA [Aurantiacibacter suaedae]|uniref:bifunctional transcriptional activator/DNA repair enzyme AdaA n=1 Tax=Aurantiacibacter suaedae TaxID=2545755 RepID=UPI0010F7A9B5|nr:methylated-DNA--[protein]-cysteine S-methyltransferase [Aurantiacibacter suaedae]